MKQRVSVRAIIIEEGKALLLKRANGRPSILGKYELPGGKVAYGEQPEDALRRYLRTDAGLELESRQTRLFDVVTYIDYDDRAIQYGVITYMVALSPQRHPMKLSGNYSKYKWFSMSSLQQNEITDLSQLLLGILQQESITEKSVSKIDKNDVANTTDYGANDVFTIFSDGGSRGNPGPSAAGYVIVNNKQEVVDEGGEYLGITTNNQAEYQGVRLGLERAVKLGYKRINFKVDSLMVVNQMKGYYKIKNRELWPVHERIRELMQKFESVSFTHVSREFNQLADGMVNKTLDEKKRADEAGKVTKNSL